MILKNKFIKIKIGKREITSHNYIYDRYLHYVNDSQFLTTESQFIQSNKKKKAIYCCLKLNETIQDITNLDYYSFDTMIGLQTYNVTGNKQQCNISYIYDSKYTYDIINSRETSINSYTGQTITGIGFCNYNKEILAYIDTSSYGIKIVQDENLVILRSDDFITNMECEGKDYALHLAPSNEYIHINTQLEPDYNSILFARLYSVGYGTSKGKMEDEFLIDNNEIQITENNFDFTFALSTGQKLTLYPKTSLHPTSNKYPQARYSYQELYPNAILHPSSNKYPIKPNVKYIIFKYQICRITPNSEVVQLNKFYTMNYFSEYIGTFTIKNKIERRT